MKVEDVMMKMIEYSKGNTHDINHFLKVYAYARTIAVKEKVDEETLIILEKCAILHDISCPVCRIKYDSTDGKLQESESDELIRAFFKDEDEDEKNVDRIAFIVSHHHTYKDVDDMAWQILLEADYLVNADESFYSKTNIINAKISFFKTEGGKELLDSIYLRS